MSKHEYGLAVQDFHRARQRAGLQQLLARWTGKSLNLLSYDEVRDRLKAYNQVERGVRQIPLDSIVGSVGRYQDFTRAFLPRLDSDASRWASVKAAQVTHGLPPISVYQIGEAYFVQDGNHRVSVARQLGNKTIEASVTEVITKVPLSPDDQLDDVILKAEHAEFMEQTRLEELRPDVDLSLTAPGKYPLLLEHIEVHRYYMGTEQAREIPYEEAVMHWADEVYAPTIRLIQEAGLIHEFPNRTDADLYVWLAEHRAEVEDRLGWEVKPAAAIADMVERFGTYKPAGLVSKALRAVLPTSRDRSAEVGRWRREREESIGPPRFVETMLVPLSGRESGWQALDQAILVAQREGSHIYGLFAVDSQAHEHGILVQALKGEFDRRCAGASVQGELIVEEGDLERLIASRGRWADLMVLSSLTPSTNGNGKEEPMLRRVIRWASGPMLIVPGAPTPPLSLLLAYDDRAASQEALYVSTYIGSHWQVSVTVLHVATDEPSGREVAAVAGEYLSEAGVAHEILVEEGEVTATILGTAAAGGHDLIVMGSPSLSPRFERALGRTVKEMLRTSECPLLLCR